MPVNRILVVDDALAMRKIITKALQKTEFANAKVVEATDGRDALDRFDEEPFDLILSDWNMPRMDGLEFCQKVRRLDKNVTIVMITTEGTMGKMDEAMDIGVDGYVVKPFEPEKLQVKVKAALARRERERARR